MRFFIYLFSITFFLLFIGALVGILNIDRIIYIFPLFFSVLIACAYISKGRTKDDIADGRHK